MLLHLTDISTEPLHEQITRQIRVKILTGELKEGDVLPSIRAMARENRVSVITVQRAYDELINEGLVYAKQGKGNFVNPLTDEMKLKIAENRLSDSLLPIIRDAVAMKLTSDQILKIVRKLIGREG